MSQDELADQIGVSRQTLSKNETGESLPDIERCKRLADVFGVTVDDLINYEKKDSLGLEVPPKGKHIFGMVKVGEKGQIVIPGGFQKIKQSFFLDQRNALPLITKHNEIISWLDIEYLSGFCRDHDLTFLTYFYHAENVFSLRWNF